VGAPVIRIEKQTWVWSDWDAECEENGMKKSDQYSRKMAELMKLAEQYGVKVKESSLRNIGFVGGVRRPKVKAVGDDDNPASSRKPSVN
jgi:hypothetical protein